MSETPGPSALAAELRRARRAKRLSLRDLAEEIGVSFNTLSRVERGYVPDLKNYQRIVDWLETPLSTFLTENPAATPDVIARHLLADPLLPAEGAEKIAALVQDMYRQLANSRPVYAVHMRSANMFLPSAGNLLADIFEDMHTNLLQEMQ